MTISDSRAISLELDDITKNSDLDDVYRLYSQACAHKRRADELKAKAARVLGRWLHDNDERISTGNGRELAGKPSVTVKVEDPKTLGKRCVFELLMQQMPPQEPNALASLSRLAGMVSELYGPKAPGITAARDMLGKRMVEQMFEEHRVREVETDDDGHPVYVATSVKERKKAP